MNTVTNILVSRTDRLGDVMMALPTLEYAREHFPNARIDFLCRPEYLEVLASYLKPRNIRGVSFAKTSTRVLSRWMRQQRFDAAVLLFPDPLILRAAWLARVPWRVGIYSKPWSFLTINCGLTQHRSESEKNEAQYNLDLIRLLVYRLGLPDQHPIPNLIELASEMSVVREACEVLKEAGISANDSYAVIHPGMGGSALNLSASQYLKLRETLERDLKFPTIISVGPSERDKALLQEMETTGARLRVITQPSLSVLREIYRMARVVIGPSTGPLHLAHYAGASTIGIYSPVQSQHPARWQPWGGTGKSTVIFPQVDCPGNKKCLESQCPHFSCMENVPWETTMLEAIKGDDRSLRSDTNYSDHPRTDVGDKNTPNAVQEI